MELDNAFSTELRENTVRTWFKWCNIILFGFPWLHLTHLKCTVSWTEKKKRQSTTCDIPFTTNIHQNGNKRDKQKHFIYNKCNGTFSIRLEISIPACMSVWFVANDKCERYCFENPVNNLKYSSLEFDWKIVNEHFFLLLLCSNQTDARLPFYQMQLPFFQTLF